MSLAENKFLEKWKLVHAIPLLKKDDPSVAFIYRPVSLLSRISKIGTYNLKHVYNFFHCNNFFYKYQAAWTGSVKCKMYLNINKGEESKGPIANKRIPSSLIRLSYIYICEINFRYFKTTFSLMETITWYWPHCISRKTCGSADRALVEVKTDLQINVVHL